MSEPPRTQSRPPPASPVARQRRLGALRHRALMLAMQGRHEEAGRLVLDELGVTPSALGHLKPEERRLVSVAATYFEKAGVPEVAADLFESLGEGERAALSLARPSLTSGSSSMLGKGPALLSEEAPPTVKFDVEPIVAPLSARSQAGAALRADVAATRSEVIASARRLISDGRSEEAVAELGARGMFYEAAVCLVKEGALAPALEQLIRVAPGDSHYPVAARTTVRLLCRLGACEGQHLSFLRDWVRDGPSDEKQAELFVRFAQLLEGHGNAQQAESVLRSVLRRIPQHVAAWERLQQLLGVEQSHTVTAPSPSLSDARRPARVEVVPEPSPDSSSPDSSVQEVGVGMVVANRFRIDAEIGRGGMATVFSARDIELDEQVAVKVFAGQLITKEWQDDAVQRFRLELKLCRKLRHPNIIQVYDIGVYAGHRYYTMELLKGDGLDRLLGAPVDVPWGVQCLIQAARGLQAAHDQGVVHRDVKPENLFVTEEGIVKVMDFGIAKSAYQPGKTQVGTFAGTPEYMAPEQINNFSQVGPAADQYSLGCVAYQMFTGVLPFSDGQLMNILMMQIERTPTPLRELNSALPEAIESVVLRMMAKRPEDRYPTMGDLADSLAELAR